MTGIDDEQLGRLLGDRLHEETQTMTAPSNLTETLHRRNRRRTRALGLAFVPPVVAAVAVGASLALTPGGGGAPRDVPEMLTVGYVAERTATALSGTSGYVQHETAKHQDPDGTLASVIESWIDPTSERERRDNEFFYGDVRSFTLALDGSSGVQLIHGKKKWCTFPVVSVEPLTSLPEGADPALVPWVAPSLDPTELRRAVDSGKLTLVGKEQLDGRQTVHLQWQHRLINPTNGPEVSMQIWVDADSYLPVRVVQKMSTVGATTSDYEWLPRTEENLAKATVSPPADYRKGPCTTTPGDHYNLRVID